MKETFIIIIIYYDELELLKTIQVEWVEKYGRIFRVWVIFRALVDISSPALMEVFFNNSYYIITRRFDLSFLIKLF